MCLGVRVCVRERDIKGGHRKVGAYDCDSQKNTKVCVRERGKEREEKKHFANFGTSPKGKRLLVRLSGRLSHLLLQTFM